MKINIKVSSKSSKNEVIKVENSVFDFKVTTVAVPAKGAANEAVISLLAEYFKVGKNSVQILKGSKSKLKTVEIDV